MNKFNSMIEKIDIKEIKKTCYVEKTKTNI